MVTAWVTIEDDVFRFLTDSTEQLRSFGVSIAQKGGRKSPRETWWLVEFDPTAPYTGHADGDILPLTYFLDQAGKLAVSGPAGFLRGLF